MYSYGWREYMPDLGRWNGIDQLAENYLSTSNYAYVANNPISNTDPDGRWINEDGSIRPSTTFDYMPGSYKPTMSFSTSDGMHGGGGGGYTFTGKDAVTMFSYFKNGGNFDGLSFRNGYMSWWTGGALGDANTAQEMIAHMMKLTRGIQKNLTDIANHKDFSADHLITSEALATFADYSLSKALRPDYSVNYTVLDDAAKPYRITTMAGIKMRPATAATLSKVAKYGGVALAVVSIGATELQYADGQIGDTERIMNHMMTGVGMIPTPWTIGAGLVYGAVTGGYQAITGRSIFNDMGLGPNKK